MPRNKLLLFEDVVTNDDGVDNDDDVVEGSNTEISNWNLWALGGGERRLNWNFVDDRRALDDVVLVCTSGIDITVLLPVTITGGGVDIAVGKTINDVSITAGVLCADDCDGDGEFKAPWVLF